MGLEAAAARSVYCSSYNPLMPKTIVWITHYVHDWTTFAVFIFLGAAQMAIAVLGVHLAILALPSGLENLVKKMRLYHVWKWSLGAAVFVLTLVVGWLNDKTQFAATQDAEKVQFKLDATKDALETSGRNLIDVVNKTNCLPPPASELGRTAQVVARQSAQRAIDDLQAQIKAGLLQAGTLPVIPPASVSAVRASTPAMGQQPGAADPPSSLPRDLALLKRELNAANIQAEADRKQAVNLAQMNTINKTRYDVYISRLPLIQDVRKRVRASKMTPEQQAQDSQMFEQLNRAVGDYLLTSTGAPDRANLGQVIEYLVHLDDLATGRFPFH